MKTRIIKFTAACLVLFLSILAPAQSGGNFIITQSVVAGGGGQNAAGGQFSLDGTIGQSLAGGLISNPPFDLFSGFWIPLSSAPTLQFSSAAYSVNENSASAAITVNRTGDSNVAVAVNYATSNGTATGGAVCGGAGIDYQIVSGTLNFAVGVLGQTFNVPICDDALVEGDETLNLALSLPNGATLGTPNTAILTIVDNDIAPTPTPTPTGTIGGRITYANSLTTTVVPFTTINAAGSVPLSTMTDSNGDYFLSSFASGAYTVTPSKTNQVNGISNLDASRVAQHIVGLTTLTANQQIAADTSGNGAVSSLDAAYIAQFVASIPNPSITGRWKFLPINRSYPNVLTNQTNQDYSAILVGDVTGNWNPSGMLRPELSRLEDNLTTEEEKTEQPVAVTARINQVAEEKTAFTINLPAPETIGADILGYQFDLLYDKDVILPQTNPCDTSGTISSGLSAVCNATTPGLLKVVVFGTEPISGSGILLKLNFNAVGMAGNISPLTFQNFLFNEDTPSAVTVNGSVLIISPTPTSTPTPSGNVCTSITTFTLKNFSRKNFSLFGSQFDKIGANGQETILDFDGGGNYQFFWRLFACQRAQPKRTEYASG